MVSKVNLPPEILEEIEAELRFYYPIDATTVIRIAVEKKILVRLGKEAKDVLGFLSKYVTRYVRDKYRLRPKSLHYFLEQKKYKETDIAEFHIPLGDLVKAGVLRREERNGYTYWVLGDRVLDPKSYIPLYRSYSDTFRTLLHELGYLELVEKYGDRVEVEDLTVSTQVARIRLDGIGIEIYTDEFKASCRYVVGKDGRLYHYDLDVEEGVGEIQVSFTVKNPTIDDIEKMKRYIEYTELVLEELVNNIKTYVEKELGVPFTTMSISGSIDITNYRVREIWISATRLTRKGRMEEEVDVNLNVRRGMSGYPNLDQYIKSHVCIAKTLISLYLRESFSSIENLGEVLDIPPDYDIYFSSSSKATTFEFNVEVEGTPICPRVLKHYVIVKNMEKILRKILEGVLEKDAEGTVTNTDGKEVPVGKVLGFLKWMSNDDVDTVRLKLATYRLEGFEDYPLGYRLVAHALLRGFAQEKVAEALNKPLDVLLEFIRSGKLKLVPYGDGYKVLFKGRSLREIFCYECYKPRRFENVLKVLLGMGLPRKEVEKISRKPVYT